MKQQTFGHNIYTDWQQLFKVFLSCGVWDPFNSRCKCLILGQGIPKHMLCSVFFTHLNSWTLALGFCLVLNSWNSVFLNLKYSPLVTWEFSAAAQVINWKNLLRVSFWIVGFFCVLSMRHLKSHSFRLSQSVSCQYTVIHTPVVHHEDVILFF